MLAWVMNLDFAGSGATEAAPADAESSIMRWAAHVLILGVGTWMLLSL